MKLPSGLVLEVTRTKFSEPKKILLADCQESVLIEQARVNAITVNQGGSGYTVAPAVTIDPPPAGDTARQALGSAILGIQEVSAIVVTDSGDGYATAPNVIITGGNGVGAVASATLDTVDFELDINGAIRTSTSIISDTARVLNLDIDNFVTPDLELKSI